jgi:hypothetical protein
VSDEKMKPSKEELNKWAGFHGWFPVVLEVYKSGHWVEVPREEWRVWLGDKRQRTLEGFWEEGE